MKRSQPRRDWADARAKVEAEGRCRNCERSDGYRLEAAHVVGREHDRPLNGKTLYVHPDSVIPLCTLCHGADHRHEVDTLPLLSLPEQVRAVEDAGGIELARIRTAPSLYRKPDPAAAFPRPEDEEGSSA